MFCVVHFLVISLAWFVWAVPFFRNRGRTPKAAVVDARARWGIALEGVGFALVWMNPYWQRPASVPGIAIGLVFVAIAWVLAFGAVPALGRQWRIEAGLNEDHELVRATAGVRARSMFGGVGIYADDTFFALIASDVLYFKVDDTNRPDFEARGAGPFLPFGDEREVMQYYAVDADILEDVEVLREWAGKAIEAARRKKGGGGRRPRKGRQ